MDLQKFVDRIEANACVFAFDVLPDGKFSELRMMSVNKGFMRFFSFNPNSPEFYPGVPARLYFVDLNFERFCYESASTHQPLYSYVNAHGAWLSGQYLPIASEEENTLYCCYILKITREAETEELSKRSAEATSAILNVSIHLHKTQDFIQAMTDTTVEIKKICDSEICSILMVDKNEKKCSFFSENGIDQKYLSKFAESMGRTPYEMAMKWEQGLRGTDCFLMENIETMKEFDIDWYHSLKSYHIKSMVLYSIHYNRKLVGFIWAANFDVKRILQIKETLELITFFIGAVIANHQLMDKLEIMSMVDMLTQVRNRNAMNKRVNQLISGEVQLPKTMGVIFADINGLKTVNDNEGHTAGDKLLQNASALLKIAFQEFEIYRAGGDEFVILCPDAEEEKVKKQAQELKTLADQTEDVSFAVGTAFFTGEYDMHSAMQVADERMYQDKEEYYRLHPEKKRRSEVKI